MITVVIPTYKRPDMLSRLLESVCSQTMKPSEVIVVDDASGMSSEYRSCIQAFDQRLQNLQYICLKQNSGAPTARNEGIRRARNDWIALVDDDDEWLPQKLEKQWAIASASGEKLGLIYTWTTAKGSSAQPSYDCKISIAGDARRAILSTNFIMSASVMARKSALLKAGLFDEEMPSCQDWDMWTRVFLAGYDCSVVPEILTIYHRHGGESIGLSINAKRGYQRFLEKHAKAIFRHTSPINIAKKLVLYVKVRSASLVSR